MSGESNELSSPLPSTLERVLLRGWLVGFGILLIWLAAFLLLNDNVFELHRRMFDLSQHELNLVMYCGMGLWKLAVLIAFFIPWLALRLVRPRS